MSILTSGARVLYQGLTGKQGSWHAARAQAYGTHIVGGVTPGKGGTTHMGIAMFNTVQEAKEVTKANTSVIFVPAPEAANAILEAINASIDLIVCITDTIPARDMIPVIRALHAHPTTHLIGPNTPGIITPGQCLLGIMPTSIYKPGSIGMLSRSGSLSYAIASQLSDAGLGQSTVVGIGGDMLRGTSYIPLLKMMYDDPKTEAVIIVTEAGEGDEEELADYIKTSNNPLPIAAFIAGHTAPIGRSLGHTGAFIDDEKHTAHYKAEILQSAGVYILPSLIHSGEAIKTYVNA